jgi:uncharacterized membrane protein YoaK (UPF0700 family)
VAGCQFCAMQQGLISRIGASLARPSANMSWLQLGATVVFVVVVALAWRQVTMLIVREA